MIWTISCCEKCRKKVSTWRHLIQLCEKMIRRLRQRRSALFDVLSRNSNSRIESYFSKIKSRQSEIVLYRTEPEVNTRPVAYSELLRTKPLSGFIWIDVLQRTCTGEVKRLRRSLSDETKVKGRHCSTQAVRIGEASKGTTSWRTDLRRRWTVHQRFPC